MFQRETNLALTKKVDEINKSNKKETLRLMRSKGGDLIAQLYEGDKFVRNLSSAAVDRRYNAVKSTTTSLTKEDITEQLSATEVNRRKDIIRNVLLDTINLENQLKAQLAILQKNARMTPFVIE